MPTHSAYLESRQGCRFCSWPAAPRVRGRTRAGRRGHFAGSNGKRGVFFRCLSRPLIFVWCFFLFFLAWFGAGGGSFSSLFLDRNLEISSVTSASAGERAGKVPHRVHLTKSATRKGDFFFQLSQSRGLARSLASSLARSLSRPTSLSISLPLESSEKTFLFCCLSSSSLSKSGKKKLGRDGPSLGRCGASPGSRCRRASPRQGARD